MLILKGELGHKNLSTTFTHIDQFVDGLQEAQFTGYCTVSFWEYDGILFFVGGKILSGREEIGIRGDVVRIGETAVENILTTAHETGGEINVYALPAEKVLILAAALDATAKYKDLSTDLTSLDKLIALLKKEMLSGYIEVLLESDAGTANLFFAEGDLVESVFAPPDNRMIGEPMSVEEIMELCQKNGAVFNVYQASDEVSMAERDAALKGTVPQEAIALFEAILIQIESVIDDIVKAGTFQSVFKKILPRIADKYNFLDPFIGDFRYANRSLSYSADATYKEFVDGLCGVINSTVASLLETIPENTLLPRVSSALEPVSTQYSELIEQLHLETQMPEILKDYSFIKEEGRGETGRKRGPETRSVLNLQGVGVSELGSESILREFYRVITAITQKHYNPEDNIFLYTSFKKSQEFQRYQTATALLQNFNLSLLKSREQALAFWLNLYNFLVIDGILEFGVNTSVQDTKDFFAKMSYRLGEYLVSLDEIEHGILRNNRRRPYSLFRQFSGTDPRKVFCINPSDNRVHCCFVCGAKSCPSLAVYTPDQLDNQLNQAVNRFLLSEKGMRVDQEKHELWLNRAFYWYRKDFERGGKTLLDFIIDHLQDKELNQFIQQNRTKVTLRFMDYDWSLNGK